MSENSKQVFKLDEEDISEILINYLTDEHVMKDLNYQAISTIMGTAGEDLRYILVLGDAEDNDFNNLDLEEADANTNFTKIDFGYEG